MKSSSSSSSASVTPGRETRLLSSSSSPPPPPPPPRLSLQSPELQAEFLQERQKKLQPHRDISESSVVSSSSPSSASSPLPSPLSTTPSSSPRRPSSSSPSPSPSCRDRSARLSLSSPELLSELKLSRTRSLRHVPAHNGLTTVFSGRGRRGGQVSGSTPFTQPANQKPSP